MIKVFGIGNTLLTDDGIGPLAAEAVKNEIIPRCSDIEILDGGTDFYYCIDNICGDDFVIIIDSMTSGAEPGTVKVITFKDYKKRYCRSIALTHDESLIEAMLLAGLDNDGIIIGIESYDMGFGTTISNVLQKKFPYICREIIEIIERQRIEISKRDDKAGS